MTILARLFIGVIIAAVLLGLMRWGFCLTLDLIDSLKELGRQSDE